uniref:Protein YIPF n=1 Tax=Equus asinus TaxID=9793 RepID=A0A9L0I7N8_EQUAS
MAAVDDLRFEEFGDAAASLAANPDTTTISIEDPGDTPKHQPGPPGGSGREEDDELLGNDDSDKTELLAGQKKSSPFWTFEYYQTFFDVDTYQVFDRIKGSLLPVPGKNFVRLYVRSNPDLYGPFWICATLVFAIAISGNLSNFLIHLGEKTYHYVPEFRKVSIAATVVYAYAWLVPLALWGFLMWRNSKVMNIVSYSFLEIVCVYGYSLFIYIPTAILWIIPQKAVRWILVMIALGVSGSVLAMTFWPAVREDNRRIALATIVTIVLLHMLLSVGCLTGPELTSMPTFLYFIHGMPTTVGCQAVPCPHPRSEPVNPGLPRSGTCELNCCSTGQPMKQFLSLYVEVSF